MASNNQQVVTFESFARGSYTVAPFQREPFLVSIDGIISWIVALQKKFDDAKKDCDREYYVKEIRESMAWLDRQLARHAYLEYLEKK